MIISDLALIEGRRYPARRRTQNLASGVAPIQTKNFSMGHVTLDPDGGQVPWHNQEQEEVYFIVEGTGEMCLGDERREVTGGQMVFIPPGVFHQLTNTGTAPLRMIYCYGPAGDVAHWKQELAGTLPRAGIDVPALPAVAHPQCTEKPEEEELPHTKGAKDTKDWDENAISKVVLDVAFALHTELGSGLLESVYERVLAVRLAREGFEVCCQVPVPIHIEGLAIDDAFRADMIVNNKVIVELKSVEALQKIHSKQLLSYLRLSGKKLGLLLNFGALQLKNGIERIAHNL